MTTATLERPATQSEICNDKVTINSKGDFTNYNYVTPEELKLYIDMFYAT